MIKYVIDYIVKLVASFFVLCISLNAQAEVACSVWDDSNWTYRKVITIQSSQVTANLTNFPVLIDITDSDLQTKAQTDGDDIYFVDSDGLSKLDHEIELYESGTGHLVAWVKVPSVSSSSNTEIYMYYGNASATDQSNPTGVWDSNYKTVWHLAENPGPGTANDIKDSTSNGNHGTAASGMTSGDLVTALAGKGINFDGTDDYIDFGDINSLDGGQKLTVSAWVNFNSLGSWDRIIDKGISLNDHWALATNGSCCAGNDDAFTPIRHNGGNLQQYGQTTGNILSTSGYHYWTMVYDGTQSGNSNRLKFYYDGVQKTLDFAGTTIPSSLDTNSGSVYVGDSPWESQGINAILDEIRTSTSVRSSDWIQTEYNNQNNPSAFYTLGSEVTECAVGGNGLACSVWDDTNWTYRKYIALQASQVTANLINFPVLINTTDTDLRDNAQTDGDDIYFTASDGITNLDHEIEVYDSSTGHIVAWVKVPSLSASTNTEIYMYYGNASATDQSNPTGVWDSNYEAVWHLAEDPGPGSAGDIKDSTSNNHDGTAAAGMTSSQWVGGEFGKAIKFNGDGEYLSFGDINQVDNINKMTVSAWVKVNTLTEWNPIVTKGWTQEQMWALHSSGDYMSEGTNDIRPAVRDGSHNMLDTNSNILSVDGQYHLWTMVFDGTQTGNLNRLKIYFDGVEKSLVDSNGTVPSATDSNSNDVLIGAGWYGGGYTSIDEVRISTSARSADWIQTEYNNQSNPSAFAVFDPQMTHCVGGGNGLGCSVWDDSNWSHRKYIALQSSQVTENLTNFPVLIDRTDTDLRDRAQADGDDIYFTASDGTTNLDHEIELYDASTGHVVAWVKVPSLSASTDTEVYMYYGNASAPDQSNPTGVWDSNFKIVQHLQDDFLDSTSNNNDGTNYGSNDTSFGKFGDAQSFNGVDSGDYIDFGNNSSLQITGEVTVEAWVKPSDTGVYRGIGGKIATSNQGFTLTRHSSDNFRFQVGDGVGNDILNSDSTYTDSNWHHIVGVRRGSTNYLYVDGVQQTQTGSRSISDSGQFAHIGRQYSDYSQRFWKDKIDEFRISNTGRSSGWIQTQYNNQNAPSSFAVFDPEMAYCGSSSADHLVINHDGNGIHCSGEPVTVTAYDNTPSIITNYEESITLDTQTSKGTWSLTSGSGTFLDTVANDGLATYTFSTADNGTATFSLSYEEGTANFNVDAFETASPSNRDDDSEGNITFTSSGFTVTASALSNPPPNPINDPISKQTAGTTFSMHLAAYGTTDTDTVCGVIETYTGTKSIKFWQNYNDPNTGTITPWIDSTAIASTEGSSAAQNVTFTSGQASVNVKYKDVGKIYISMKDDTVTPSITGSSNNFVVKPSTFSFYQISKTDETANPGTSTPSGTAFIKAGEAFKVVVEAHDAEGSVTPNYGNESTPEGITILADTLVAPSGGRNGSNNDGAMGNPTAFTVTSTPGRFENSTTYWDEVGAITLKASVSDGDYLATGDDVTSASSGTVGRFTPSYFDASSNVPLFKTYCGSGANGFTYQGQPFNYAIALEPIITVTAKAQGGTITENYSDSWWRLTPGTLSNITYATAVGTLDTSAAPSPAVAYYGDGSYTGAIGTGTITFSSGTGLYFTRPSSTPIAAFDADISLSVDVQDADNIAYSSNPVAFGAATAGNGIDFDQSKQMLYARLKIDNAYGSDLLALDIPAKIQTYNNAQQSFITNTLDNCTTMIVENFSCNYTPVTVTPAISFNGGGTFSSGTLNLQFAPSNNKGNIDIEALLGGVGSGGTCNSSTGKINANLGWLQYDWLIDGNADGNIDDNPTAIGTYGVHGNSKRNTIIYMHEVW